MESIHRMISCYDCLHDEENGSRYINLLFKVSDKEGSRVMESIAMFGIGKMLYHQGDKERAFYHLNEAVKMMEESDYKYKFDNLTYEYNTLLVLLMREGSYEEALKILDKLQLLTSGGDEGDVVKMENLPDKEKKTYYAQRAVLLFKFGRTKEADEAYASWRSIGDKYAKDDYLIVPYLMNKKEYATVISIYKKQEAFLKAHSDTITYHMKMVQHILGDAYNAIGDYEKASQYYKQLSVLVDSLKMREQKSTALEMAEFYDKSEREIQLQEEKNRVRTRTQMFLSVSVVAVVLLVRRGRVGIGRREGRHLRRAVRGLGDGAVLDLRQRVQMLLFGARDLGEEALELAVYGRGRAAVILVDAKLFLSFEILDQTALLGCELHIHENHLCR